MNKKKLAVSAKHDREFEEAKNDYEQIEKLLENPNYSSEAKAAAIKTYLEKWSQDVVFTPFFKAYLQNRLTKQKDMVFIPGRRFTMGCAPNDSNCREDEKPAHRVTVASILMDRHEVTVAEYQECVNTGICKPACNCNQNGKLAPYYNAGRADRQDHPINGVHWIDARKYCHWRGKRLPSEAEFEGALRPRTKEITINPWGNDPMPPSGYGNLADETFMRAFGIKNGITGYDDGYAGTSPVCSFSREPDDLCDLDGNVAEWCLDIYSPDYYSEMSWDINPSGPSESSDPNKTYRSIRGNSFSNRAGCWSSSRYLLPENTVRYDVGFRCVKDL